MRRRGSNRFESYVSIEDGNVASRGHVRHARGDEQSLLLCLIKSLAIIAGSFLYYSFFKYNEEEGSNRFEIRVGKRRRDSQGSRGVHQTNSNFVK
jgi:hypothetical protein